MNTLGDVIATVQNAVGDADGDWCDVAYVMPFIHMAYTNGINRLANTCSPFMTDEITLPNVEQGTTDLSSYQVQPQTGAQLSGQKGAYLRWLRNPFDIYWKAAGQPISNYCLGNRKEFIPFIDPSSYVVGQNMFWMWQKYKLRVTPMGFNADFLVRGEFTPALPVNIADTIPLHPACDVALGFETAALTGGSRVNPNLVATWKEAATLAWDDIAADLVRQEQGVPHRVGRMGGRRGGRGGFTGYGG